MVEDTPRDFGNGYSPGNAGGNTYGTVTLREALSRSLNVATVDLADLVGVSAVRGYAERFLGDAQVGDTFQFLRMGYFCKDPDSTDELPVFNRVVGLKDSFAKQVKG